MIAKLIALPLVVCFSFLAVVTLAGDPNPFGIQVVDDQSGRGVPLVVLTTVNHLRYVTDSAGWIAFNEPGLMDRPVFFHVKSHGYTYPKDGFGYAGIKLTPREGGTVTIKVTRQNVAERLYRVTGEGIYRDSVLLRHPTPLAKQHGTGQVAGQDSVFGVTYRGKLHWFWGDTLRMSYPLGHFWMAGAVSDPPSDGGLDPAIGVNLTYFTDSSGFSRPVCRLGVEEGLIWADAFQVVPDRDEQLRLVCRYAHMESLAKMLGHGFAIWNDARQEFEKVKELDLALKPLFPPQAHPLSVQVDGREFRALGEVFPTVRVRAQLDALLDPDQYEVWTCLAPEPSPKSSSNLSVLRDASGTLLYAWRKGGRPVDIVLERQLVADGLIQPQEAHFLPVDVDTGKRLRLHRGSVHWNAYRQRYIVIAVEKGGTSNLGEVWYAEADSPTGPWLQAKKIVTHERYDFYNPVHHPFFDQKSGRLIYFEGTYVNTFSGNPVSTPRYDYNQIMYRLDLADPRLKPLQIGKPAAGL